MFVRWLFRAAALVMALLFCAYFVCVQINAIAYLAGDGSAIISGTAPPVPLHSDAAATADILIGLIIEAFTALVAAIAIATAFTSFRNARQRRRDRP